MITLLNIVELTYREINSHVNSTENKKINTNAKKMLFDNGTLFDYMFTKDENTVMKFYTLIDDIVDLDAKYKEQARAKVHEHYPNIKFRVTEDQSKQSNALIVTMAKLSEKKAELEKRLKSAKIDITVMIQKEVADRLGANPGDRLSGAITYSVAYYAVAEKTLIVPKDSFIPEPEVTSEVIKLNIRKQKAVKVNNEKVFF